MIAPLFLPPVDQQRFRSLKTNKPAGLWRVLLALCHMTGKLAGIVDQRAEQAHPLFILVAQRLMLIGIEEMIFPQHKDVGNVAVVLFKRAEGGDLCGVDKIANRMQAGGFLLQNIFDPPGDAGGLRFRQGLGLVLTQQDFMFQSANAQVSKQNKKHQCNDEINRLASEHPALLVDQFDFELWFLVL